MATSQAKIDILTAEGDSLYAPNFVNISHNRLSFVNAIAQLTIFNQSGGEILTIAPDLTVEEDDTLTIGINQLAIALSQGIYRFRLPLSFENGETHTWIVGDFKVFDRSVSAIVENSCSVVTITEVNGVTNVAIAAIIPEPLKTGLIYGRQWDSEASDYQWAEITGNGGGEGSGTVTSIGISGGTEINATGSPVTDNGTIALEINQIAQSKIINLTNDLMGLQSALNNKQPTDSDLDAIAGLTPTNDDIIQRKTGVWVNRTPNQLKTDLLLTKSDVGLGNVPNLDTSDATNISSGTLGDSRLSANITTQGNTLNAPHPNRRLWMGCVQVSKMLCSIVKSSQKKSKTSDI